LTLKGVVFSFLFFAVFVSFSAPCSVSSQQRSCCGSHKHSVLQTLLACTLLECIEPQPGSKQSCVKLTLLKHVPPLLLFSSCGDNRQMQAQRLALFLQALLLARIEAQMAGNKELASGLLIPAALQDEAARCTPCPSLPPLLSFCCTAAIYCQTYTVDLCSQLIAHIACLPASQNALSLLSVKASCTLCCSLWIASGSVFVICVSTQMCQKVKTVD